MRPTAIGTRDSWRCRAGWPEAGRWDAGPPAPQPPPRSPPTTRAPAAAARRAPRRAPPPPRPAAAPPAAARPPPQHRRTRRRPPAPEPSQMSRGPDRIVVGSVRCRACPTVATRIDRSPARCRDGATHDRSNLAWVGPCRQMPGSRVPRTLSASRLPQPSVASSSIRVAIFDIWPAPRPDERQPVARTASRTDRPTDTVPAGLVLGTRP
jgi:hypothetical protein